LIDGVRTFACSAGVIICQLYQCQLDCAAIAGRSPQGGTQEQLKRISSEKTRLIKENRNGVASRQRLGMASDSKSDMLENRYVVAVKDVRLVIT
jgi:hypothetical protein